MEKSWFNFLFSQGEFEYIGELSKATDSFAPFEIDNDLSDLEFGFYSYCRSSYLYNGSKSDNDPHYDPYIKDTKSNFNNYFDNYINSCMDSYFRSHIGIDSHFLGDSNNSGGVELNKLWRGVDLSKLWVLCDSCYQSLYRKFNKMYICEECGHYLKINSKERIELLIDPGTWDPMDEDMVSLDPIEWDWEDETSTFNLNDQYRLKDHLRYLKKESEKLSRAARRKLLDRDRELRRKLLESQKELEETSQVDSDSQEETSEVDLKRWQEQMDNFAREARRKLLEALEETSEVDSDSQEGTSEVDSDSQEGTSEVDSDSLEETSQVDSDSLEETSQVDSDSQEGTSQVDSDSQKGFSKVDLKRWKEQIDELSRAARRKLLEWQEETSPFDLDSEEETYPFDSDSEEEEEEEEEETSPVDLKSVQEELDNIVRELRKKLLELQKELEENSQVDSDSQEGTSQVDSDSQKGFSEVDLKRWLEQLDEMSRKETSQVDSDSQEETSEVDSDSLEETSQVDSDSEEETSEVDSDSQEETSEVDSDSQEEEETYKERLDYDQKTTGLTEAIQTGTGKLNGIPVAIGVMDFEVIGGSMGSVVGEKITRLIEYATNQRLPLILVCSSGGARMQEGSLSLMQMAKISSALYDYQLRKRLFYISILASPTTGGVTASFGMLGDIVIAEPYAYIAFAGKRVIEETLKIEVPEGSQVAELLFDTGLLDAIVPRNILKGVLSELFQLHAFFPLNKN